jgi:hypothetical protein
MPNYRLHYFPESGNSYKLAPMLTLCGQSFELVWTANWTLRGPRGYCPASVATTEARPSISSPVLK